jgi:hypothetical protein
VVAGVVAVPAAAVLAPVLGSVAGGTAVVSDAPETVPPKSPMSLANAALRSARVPGETLYALFAVPDALLLSAKSLMSAVSSATRPC